MKNLLLLYLTVATLMSCKTNELYINVLQPAPVTMPQAIKKIGIIDRSIPTDETKLADIIDRAVTLESADLDKDGAKESIKGLREELLNNQRFTDVKLIDNTEFRASRIGFLPPPLSWDIVTRLCTEAGSDALFALERFDTDTRIDFSGGDSGMGIKIGNLPVLKTAVTMEVIVKTGWRIYYPTENKILEEFSFAESIVYDGRGINPVAALEGLLNRKEAVKEVSRMAGNKYAMRILPFRLDVTRDYYVKGTDNFKIARRKAQMGKWDEAATLWEKETDNPKSKIAGRAVYNMAIINEINGRLDDALGWTQKAWEDYNIKRALKYARILKGRKYDNELLKLQEDQ
ncbi:MAG: DUF6340 family protein [Bacteroidales bacterium]|nr:DUF6340 family protein [Bacteroidales bacterium]